MAATLYFESRRARRSGTSCADWHESILDRIAFEKLPACIVHLGDFVDRGPDSHGVIEHNPRARSAVPWQRKNPGDLADGKSRADDARRVRLGRTRRFMVDAGRRGNRPIAMRAQLDWPMRNGARQFPANTSWMRRLPLIHQAPDRKLVFVHAGIEPLTSPTLLPSAPISGRVPTVLQRLQLA